MCVVLHRTSLVFLRRELAGGGVGVGLRIHDIFPFNIMGNTFPISDYSLSDQSSEKK